MSDFEHEKGQLSYRPAHEVDPLELVEHPELDPVGAVEVIAGQGVPWNSLPQVEEDYSLIGLYYAHRHGIGPYAAHVARAYAKYARRKRRRFNKANRPAKSLKWLAAQIGKSTRTVREYCKAGVVPEKFAWRTAGGHWRVSSSKRAVRAVRRAMESFARRPKKNKEAREVQRIIKKTHVARRVALTADHKLPEDEAHLETLEPLSVRAKGAAETDPRGAMLRVAARYLYRQSTKMTREALAEQLGVSRMTLFKRYTAEQIRKAIRDAPLSGAVGKPEDNEEFKREPEEYKLDAADRQSLSESARP